MKEDKLGKWLQAQQRLGVGIGEEWQFPLLCKLPLPDPSSPVITEHRCPPVEHSYSWRREHLGIFIPNLLPTVTWQLESCLPDLADFYCDFLVYCPMSLRTRSLVPTSLSSVDGEHREVAWHWVEACFMAPLPFARETSRTGFPDLRDHLTPPCIFEIL